MAAAAIAAKPPVFGYSGGRAGLSPYEQADLVTWAREGNADLLRLGITWKSVEPLDGAFRWGPYDQLYRAALAQGVTPHFVIRSAPAWAVDLPTAMQCFGIVNCAAPPANSQHELSEWGKFAARVAERYPQAAAIEIWNEPNKASGWRPRPDALRYARLLDVAYRHIKAVDRDMPVLIGGLAGRAKTSPLTSDVDASEFLETVLRFGVATESFDGLSFHYYPYGYRPSDPRSGFERALRELRRITDRYVDRRVPVWLTEVGYSAPRPPGNSTLNQQADWLVELYQLAAKMPDIAAVFVYTLPNPVIYGGGETPYEQGLRVLEDGSQPRPAYRALRREVARISR